MTVWRNMTKDQEDLKTAVAESAELINEARESFERLVGSGFYPGGRINQEELDEYTQTLETASRTNLRKMGDLHRSIMKCIRRARKVSKTKKW